MHLYKHIELIDQLLIEATHHLEQLEHAMRARRQAETERAYDVPGSVFHPEPYTLEEERAWWQQAHDGLLTVRIALQEIDKSARQGAVCQRRPETISIPAV